MDSLTRNQQKQATKCFSYLARVTHYERSDHVSATRERVVHEVRLETNEGKERNLHRTHVAWLNYCAHIANVFDALTIENFQRKMEAHVVLGVPKDASEEKIRASYKALAMKWHPDRQLNNREEATAKFVEINKANRTMLRNIRRARRSTESTPNSSVSGSSPSSPASTSTPLPETVNKSTRPSNPRPSSSQQSPRSSHFSSSTSRSSAGKSSSSTLPTDDTPRGRSSSRSSSQSDPSPAEIPSFDTSPTASTSSPKHARSRLRKQSRSTNCRPDPLTGEYTPKNFSRRKSTATATASIGPERMEETLHPVRSILRGAGADAPKKWVHVLNMTLEEIYHGKTFNFRVVRYKQSGKKSIVPLDLHVLPGTRPGTEIVVEGAGNERKDGTMQSVVFLIKEMKHERFRRLHDDLVMDVRLPWVDSLNEHEGEVYFHSVDGKEHMFRVDYHKHRLLSGTVVIPSAGMPSLDGEGRGRVIIRWDISSPSSSWDAIKNVLKFKS